VDRPLADGTLALHATIAAMGRLAEERLGLALRAFLEQRADLAERVIAGDREMDALQRDVDQRAFTLIGLHQPVARDLRAIGTAVKANVDLERIGDLAVNIAQSATFLAGFPPVGPEPAIGRMGDLATLMVRDAVRALLESDAGLARHVLEQDDAVDDLRTQVFRTIVARMREAPSLVEPGVGLLLISRSLERVADHATNLAEDAIFVAEGLDVRHGSERGSS
jgi:phosphate transport system protein